MTSNDIIRVAEEVARQYPRAYSHCHDEGPEENDFIILVGQACNRIDKTVGNNWSRAQIGDLARDGLTVQRGGKFFFTDIVRDAGTNRQKIVYNETGECPEAGWVDPFSLQTEFHYNAPVEPIKPVEPTIKLDRGEFFDEIMELDRFYTVELQRPNGLSIHGRPDFEGLAAWIFDVYLNARLQGKSKNEARNLYQNEIRKSTEWRDKNR